MQRVTKVIYDLIMIVLVMVTILTLWAENEINSVINLIVWLIFLVDYIVRIIMAEQKWQFVKQNPFLLIAVIPFDQFFQVARIVRLLYLFRIKTITKYYISPYLKKLSNITLVLFFALIPILLSLEAVFIWKMENQLSYLSASFAAVFKHLFIFAGSMDTIEHFPTIVVLTITSFFGVIMQGVVLQWFFEKFETMWMRRCKLFSTSRNGG
ncbi:transporter [Gracilibacillus caseinilyticus]|uniref:Transporter n=1 Tax=Gracilibacillus caseinilyticus TaxID=2932256 RepID=A0ABY4EUE1_9BACI|nr:transporter [Gracilibacillus caseinilyticus]UOQ47508.1 transporter [Gracilibacillus caseinilyticus]